MKKLSAITAVAVMLLFVAFNMQSTAIAHTAGATITFPVDQSTGVSTKPTITWNAVGGAVDYRLQVDVSSSFNSPVIDMDHISGTSQQVNLSSSQLYYARVKDNQTGVITSFGTPISFTTQ